MACVQPMHVFDEGDAIFLGDGDLFGGAVHCIAGELELQVQSYEGVGDVPVGDSAAGKSFSMTKDSGGSSLSALAADFGDPDFMDNVSLDDLAAADHYGHNICGRQSTADSTAAVCSGRNPGTWNGAWGADPKPQPACGRSTAPEQHPAAQESSDCDMSHTHGDGESSGVGPGKSVALGSSHSEASEDNTAGVAPGAAMRDEEHISMPSFGLSLTRLTHGSGKDAQRKDSHLEGQHQQGQDQHKPQVMPQQIQQDAQQQQRQQQQQQVSSGDQQRTSQMMRAFSVDNFALTGSVGACKVEDDATAAAEGQRRTSVYRSYSYVAPDTLPMDFVLGGCGDSSMYTFGARGRCASLNETQLRRQWLREGEFLGPQLPPSVSELELLELPEDTIPVRPSSTGPLLGGAGGGDHVAVSSSLLGSGTAGGAKQPLGAGLMQFKGSSSSSGAGSADASGGAGAGAQQGGVTVTVKRKIITSPSPLLQQSKPSRARNSTAAAAAAAAAPGATPKGQSPKRAKLSSGLPADAGAWQEGGAAAPQSSAGLLAGWHPPRQPGGGGGGNMKTVRSMPANMNSYLDGVEVTVQPLGGPGPSSNLISPAGSNASAATLHNPQVFPRGTPAFFDPSAAGHAGAGGRGGAVPGAPGAASQGVPGPSVAAGKGARSKAAAAQPLPAGAMPHGTGMAVPGTVPGAFMGPGILIGPDGKRMGPLPSVPKPRKRASPNGNPPKAPAPNPNGHCCTQCGTQTTPVWRAGPHGPKTLCNACGVRYMKVAKGNVAPTPRRQQH